jgi:Tfp pilus assembly protein PilE
MRRTRGFSLVELTVVVVGIGILAGALLDRVLPLIGRAQRTAFMQVKADLQTRCCSQPRTGLRAVTRPRCRLWRTRTR